MRARRVAATHSSMLPWALDRHDPMPATREARRTADTVRFTRRRQTAPGVPSPERDEKAKILGFVWLRTARCCFRPRTRRSEGRPPAGPVRWQPEDCYASGPPSPAPEGARPGSVAAIQVVPKDAPDLRSTAPRRVRPSADRDPEGFPPCRSVSPEGARSPAVAPRAPKSGAATPARSPGGLAPVVRDSPGPRVPPGGDARAIGWLAVGSHARRHGRRRATQRVPRRTRARAGSDDPRRNRFELAAEAIRRSPRLVAPALQRTGGRPRARQTSSPSERPGPIRRPSPPPARRPTDRRSIPKDRSVGGAVVPRSPPVGWCPAARAEALAAATCRSAPRASSSRSPRMLSHRARRSAPGVPPR